MTPQTFAMDPRSGGPMPEGGRITWAFELALLARQVACPPAPAPGSPLKPRVLACLPVAPERALSCAEVCEKLLCASPRQVGSYLCLLVKRRQAACLRSPRPFRYYRLL